ncbi:rCG54159, partial [Rattus norvegicus]
LFFQLCFFFRIRQASKRAQANKNKQDTKSQGSRPHIDTEQGNQIGGKESQEQLR